MKVAIALVLGIIIGAGGYWLRGYLFFREAGEQAARDIIGTCTQILQEEGKTVN